MSPEFVVGELVNIQIRGARVTEQVAAGALDFDLYGWPMRIRPGLEGVTVSRVAPPEWPPVAGDIWLDVKGAEWHAMVHETRSGTAVIFRKADDAADWRHTADVLADDGPMCLDRRRGWARTEPAAEPEPAEPAEVDERAAFCAGLRELADFLEARTDLPVPYQSHNQFSVPVEDAYAVAALMGVEVERDDETAIGAELIFGGRVRYNLYASKPKPKPAPEPVVAIADPVVSDALRERRAITAQTRRDLDATFGPADGLLREDPNALPADAVRFGPGVYGPPRRPYDPSETPEQSGLVVAGKPLDDLIPCAAQLRDGVHTHFCALVVYATGDHREDGDHICNVDRCGHRWPYEPVTAGA